MATNQGKCANAETIYVYVPFKVKTLQLSFLITKGKSLGRREGTVSGVFQTENIRVGGGGEREKSLSKARKKIQFASVHCFTCKAGGRKIRQSADQNPLLYTCSLKFYFAALSLYFTGILIVINASIKYEMQHENKIREPCQNRGKNDFFNQRCFTQMETGPLNYT